MHDLVQKWLKNIKAPTILVSLGKTMPFNNPPKENLRVHKPLCIYNLAIIGQLSRK